MEIKEITSTAEWESWSLMYLNLLRWWELVRSSRLGGRQRPLGFNWPKLNTFCDFLRKSDLHEILNIAGLRQFHPLFRSAAFPECSCTHRQRMIKSQNPKPLQRPKQQQLQALLLSSDGTHSTTACLLSQHLVCVCLFRSCASYAIVFHCDTSVLCLH